MKHVLAVTLIVVLAAAPVLAQHSITMTTSGAGGATVVRQGGTLYGSGSPAKTLLSSAAWSRYIIYGRVPLVYKILDLTDEQVKAIEAVCAEAKDANMALYKRQHQGRQGKSREEQRKVYAERKEQQDALVEKFQARILDVLTAKQKDMLTKIRTLAEQKAAEDKKISEEAKAAYDKVMEKYEELLTGVLTPEQMEKLEAELKAGQQGREGHRH